MSYQDKRFGVWWSEVEGFGEFFSLPSVVILVDPVDSFGKNEGLMLLDDFSYRDTSGKIWTIAKGDFTNGASIPKWAWEMIGYPLLGPHRIPAFLHDHYWSAATSWLEIHACNQMFYQALRANGTDRIKAGMMFDAVEWAARSQQKFPVTASEVTNLTGGMA